MESKISLPLLTAILIVTITAQAAGAQTSTETSDRADSLFSAELWEEAANAYRSLVESDRANGLFWLRLASSLNATDRAEKAIEAYEKALEIGFAPGVAHFGYACALSRLGNRTEAFLHLERAFEEGYRDLELLRTDPRLAPLRDQERFSEVVESAKRSVHPCLYDPFSRQLDFWIGDWEVFTPQGQKAGENKIVPDQDGCLLIENWTSSRGSRGMSINYFDPSSRTWRQSWIDDGGAVIRYEGGLIDGAMHLEGVNSSRDGSVELSRMTLTPNPDGTIIQKIEQSRDQGENWYVWFEGRYIRKGAPQDR